MNPDWAGRVPRGPAGWTQQFFADIDLPEPAMTLALILACILLVNVLMAGLFSLVALWAD